MTTRQIPFIFEEQTRGIPFVYSDEHILSGLTFAMGGGQVKSLVMSLAEESTPRIIDFSMGGTTRPIHFPVGIWDIVPATLGVLDPYTLGDLDSMSIGFRMYDGLNELIFTDVHGVNGDGIFKYDEPVHFDYMYRVDPFNLPFCLGNKFMRDRWYTKPKPLGMAIWNTDNGTATSPLLAKGADPVDGGLAIHNRKAELRSWLRAWCKSIYGMPRFLGEFDPLTLGELDPIMLDATARNIAVEMKLGQAELVPVGLNVAATPAHEGLALQNASLQPISVVTATPVGKVDGLVNGRMVWAATLGDLDPHNLLAVDNRKLDMRVFSRTPAIVTTD